MKGHNYDGFLQWENYPLIILLPKNQSQKHLTISYYRENKRTVSRFQYMDQNRLFSKSPKSGPDCRTSIL